MAARGGMPDLITELRVRTNAGTADYTLAGGTYWTDDQLQNVLDRHRRDIRREPLEAEISYANGTAYYHEYHWASGRFVEGTASGTAAWQVEDGAGSLISTALYTVSAFAQQVRFTADQDGTAYYLSYRVFDLDRAAAEVWRAKAAHVADRYDIQTDNHKLSRSQLMKHYSEMAQQYERSAKAVLVKVRRTDAY